MSSFKDRFRDRNEVVGRDGSNSFAAPKSHASHQTRQSVQQQQQQPSVSAASPLVQQQQSQQQQQTSVPSIYGGQQPYTNGSQQAYQAPQQQPSFFMTGGGFPAVPPINFNPYGATSVPQLPPIGPTSMLSYAPGSQQDPFAQNQYASQPLATQQVLSSPSQASPSQVTRNRLFSAEQPPMDESPVQHGRSLKRKERLPDFHELAVLDRERRTGRSVERMPVLIDHPHGGEYHEHDLTEYRDMLKEYKKIKWGGLGPEDNEQKRAEREKRRKTLEYAKQVNAVNFALMDVMLGDEWHDRPIEKKLTLDAQLGLIKRQRAVQYAEAVKPSVISARGKAKTPQPIPTAEVGKQLETLEEKHRRDQEAIMRIKAQLNMLA